jgi:molybdopterin-guanine dinucleotide biosynthesis protein A
MVLAGGRSSRFGRDKLAEPIDGEPLLWRPVRALVEAGCVEVLVVLPPTGAEPVPPGDLATAVRAVRDRAAFRGPLSGLASGLAALDLAGSARVVLVVGGDQPSLSPAVLIDLAGRIRRGRMAAALADATGRMRPLPMALAIDAAARTAPDLLATEESRLRALPEALDAQVVSFAAWTRLDPSANTLADIDSPSDLPETPLVGP